MFIHQIDFFTILNSTLDYYHFLGVPVSPSDDCEKYELHINADIALALRHYIYATGTVPDALKDLSTQLADYWLSRKTWLPDREKYGILGNLIVNRKF